jgi:hypothetical protein
MKKMIKRIIPEEDVPEYFNKLHNISGKVASKFYNDMETPVQIILGPIGSGKTFCSSAIVILFEPRPIISSSTLGTGICSQANLIIFICSANVFPEPIGPRIICTSQSKQLTWTSFYEKND